MYEDIRANTRTVSFHLCKDGVAPGSGDSGRQLGTATGGEQGSERREDIMPVNSGHQM